MLFQYIGQQLCNGDGGARPARLLVGFDEAGLRHHPRTIGFVGRADQPHDELFRFGVIDIILDHDKCRLHLKSLRVSPIVFLM
ncbi:MAG: hypothetical protein NTZ79_19120 [Proteobacteria bacterium]|nr:hypothetical protein [Pseudomonadota bacterium]